MIIIYLLQLLYCYILYLENLTNFERTESLENYDNIVYMNGYLEPGSIISNYNGNGTTNVYYGNS